MQHSLSLYTLLTFSSLEQKTIILHVQCISEVLNTVHTSCQYILTWLGLFQAQSVSFFSFLSLQHLSLLGTQPSHFAVSLFCVCQIVCQVHKCLPLEFGSLEDNDQSEVPETRCECECV